MIRTGPNAPSSASSWTADPVWSLSAVIPACHGSSDLLSLDSVFLGRPMPSDCKSLHPFGRHGWGLAQVLGFGGSGREEFEVKNLVEALRRNPQRAGLVRRGLANLCRKAGVDPGAPSKFLPPRARRLSPKGILIGVAKGLSEAVRTPLWLTLCPYESRRQKYSGGLLEPRKRRRVSGSVRGDSRAGLALSAPQWRSPAGCAVTLQCPVSHGV